ncbi:60S ribosomal protein L10a-like [Artibeus jamaicensis]|uniref:60S ribosomal protein L10a-like n=1 Tax=Artibeus jamaicensis TaxID=9417 RepID=UPI00235A7784|nr:60S ribosomal protein L10a-like [Artibeus jamaicensis]
MAGLFRFPRGRHRSSEVSCRTRQRQGGRVVLPHGQHRLRQSSETVVPQGSSESSDPRRTNPPRAPSGFDPLKLKDEKLGREAGSLLAAVSLTKQIPGTLGPGLREAGRFPSSPTHSGNTVAHIDGVGSEIQFHKQKLLRLAVAIGRHVKTAGDEVGDNVHLAVRVLMPLLERSWRHLPALCTRGARGTRGSSVGQSTIPMHASSKLKIKP